MKTKLRDLTLLFGSLMQFCCRIVFHSCFEDREDLGGRFSGCAHDEDSPELLLVAVVCFLECELGSFVFREGGALLLC